MSQRPQACEASFSKLNAASAVNLAVQLIPGAQPFPFNDGPLSWNGHAQQGGTEATDHMYQRFNNVITLIDQDRYTGDEKDLFVCDLDSSSTSPSTTDTTTTTTTTTRGQFTKTKKPHSSSRFHHDSPKGHTTAVAASIVSGSYFAKVELYANSRLPMNLPPLKLYIPTWPLLCLAAQYSERVYEKPTGAEKDIHVGAESRGGGGGTRATVIKSVPMDHMNTIVFAIRGTASFSDWAVNLDTEPTSPAGFLDDEGNHCHAGFLKSARKLIKPVAARLRQLLREDPMRSSSSLLITGHSAGGAVAALLYAHMVLTSASGPAASELNALTSRFRRVHCVTFGAPPMSLLPLRRPPGRPDLVKSLFLSFVNEGDPVARADRAYVRSLLELFARPAPVVAERVERVERPPPPSSSLLVPSSCPRQSRSSRTSSLVSNKSGRSGKCSNKSSTKTKGGSSRDSRDSSTASTAKTSSSPPSPSPPQQPGPIWQVPPSTLSNAGRIVVLRSGSPGGRRVRVRGSKTVEERLDEGVVAQVATDEQLRAVVWGSPVCHLMRLYAGRLEILAIGAVTARGC